MTALALVATLLSLAGCASAPDSDTVTVASSDEPMAAVDSPSGEDAAAQPEILPAAELEPEVGPYDFALRLQPGTIYPLNATIEQTVTESMMGMTIELTQSFDAEYLIDVTSVHADGSIDAVLTYNVTDVTLGADGSDDVRAALQQSTAEATATLGPVFEALSGLEFSLTVSPDGVVQTFSGANDYREILGAGVEGVSDEALSSVQEMLAGLLSDEYLADAWSVYFGHIPPGPVSIGDTWTRELSLSQGMSMVSTNTYTLVDVTADTYTVQVAGSIAADDDASNSDVSYPGFSIAMSIEGAQTGRVVASRSTGWVVSQEWSVDATGEMTLEQEDPPHVKIGGTFSTSSTTRVE